jgi:hypothetical protein
MEERSDGAIPWMSKACEAWRAWSDTHMQISQQLTDLSVNVAKDSMSLYAEVYATNIEALKVGQTYVVQHLQGIPETLQQPCNVEHAWVQACVESAGKIGRLWQNSAQAVLRSSEQSWLTAQQTGHNVMETYSQLYNKLTALYTTS